LADDLGQFGGLHAPGLKLGEGRASADRAQLFGGADQHDSRLCGLTGLQKLCHVLGAG
jgi:hypothetical protein